MTTPSLTITQEIIDNALMSGAVYVSSRNIINQIPIPPANWTVVRNSYESFVNTGFEGAAFQNGNNIVIAYTGSNDALDWVANLELGTGTKLSPQLVQAAELYLNTKHDYPGATISFTGHSLGGGLASLMSAFFGPPAITFDQAPFANSVNVATATARVGRNNQRALRRM